MSMRKTGIYVIVAALICLGGVLAWYGELHKTLLPSFPPAQSDRPSPSVPSQQQTPQEASTPAQPEDAPSGPSGQEKRTPIPKEAATVAEDKTVVPLPPSPPLPTISPQASQAERQQIAGFKDSVDYIVRADEPFEVGGKTWTIDQIRNRLLPEEGKEPLLPQITEADVGPSIRKPIVAPAPQRPKPADYYAVRIVQPGDNLWNIHYQIIRDYLARRHIILAADADKPHPDGRSSGIGRLLKFIESVVVVYDFDKNRAEKDLNLIHPYHIVVFFKISDLLSALDQLQPDDLNRIRYVNNFLKIDRLGAASELLDRRVFWQ